LLPTTWLLRFGMAFLFRRAMRSRLRSGEWGIGFRLPWKSILLMNLVGQVKQILDTSLKPKPDGYNIGDPWA
jgi:hypothetical protein